MKLNLDLLKTITSLPKVSTSELRHVFDDLGLEVEGMEEVLGVTIFNIETLAHRGDHLSALGVAREFAGRYLTTINYPQLISALPNQPIDIPVRVCTDLCPVYSLLELHFSTPFQIDSLVSKFLDSENEHPQIVQLSNYVLSELGHPTHAFDATKIVGQLSVVLSTEEEEIVALDQKTYRVPVNSLLIRDAEKTVAVAGVIGCANSMVNHQTTKVLVEAAVFCPTTVRKTARAMGLSTDASYLFERGADICLPDLALRRIAHLVQGSKLVAFSSVKSLPKCLELEIELSRFQWHLNQPQLTTETVAERLIALGYQIKISGGKIQCLVPSHRFWNVKTEACVIEDYCRAVGYNSIVATIPAPTLEEVEATPNEILIEAFEPILTAAGFNEVITRSYYSTEEVSLIAELDQGLADQHLKIINSLEGAYSNLKLTNLIHLAKVVSRSLRFNLPSVKVYEFGRIFNKSGFENSDYEFEKDFLTIAFAGRWCDNNWKKPAGVVDSLANFNGVLQGLMRALKIDFQVLPSQHPLLHPGRQARLVSNNQTLAVFGCIHPLLKDRLDLKEEMIFSEVYLRECSELRKVRSEYKIIDFPVIKWDLTFKVPKRIAASHVLQLLQQINPQFLKSATIIDSFDKPDENFTRISYRLLFQEATRTLSNEEVDRVVANLLVQLKEHYQLELVS